MRILLVAALVLGLTSALAAEDSRVDRFGDPLPIGAVSRCGTLRYRPSTDGSFAVDTSSDRRLIATGESGAIRFWERATGKEVGKVDIGGVSTIRVAFSPDGRRLIAHVDRLGMISRPIFNDETVFLVDVERREIVRKWDYQGLNSARFKYAQGGKQILVSNEVGLHAHEAAAGRKIYSIAKVNDFDLSADENTVFAAIGDRIELIDCATGKAIRSWKAKNGRFERVRVSSDGKRLLSHGTDRPENVMPAFGTTQRREDFCDIWEVATSKSISRREDATGKRSDALSPDGNVVKSNVGSNGVYWDADAGKDIAWRQSKELSKIKTATLANGLKLTAVSTEVRGLDRAFETQFAQSADELASKIDVIQEIRAERDGREIWKWKVAETPRSWGNYISVIDEKTGVDLADLNSHRRPIGLLQITGDSRHLLSFDDGASMHIWELSTGKPLPAPSFPEKPFRFAFLDGGKKVAAVCLDASVQVWDMESGKQLQRFTVGDRTLAQAWHDTATRVFDEVGETCDFTTDGSRLVVTSGCEVEVWSVAAGERLHHWKTEKKSPIRHLSFWNHERSILIGSEAREYSLYTLDGNLVKEWGLTVRMSASDRSHNGKWLAFEDSQCLQSLDLDRVETVKRIAREDGKHFNSWCVSGDSTVLATIRDQDDVIQLWDIKSGDELRTIMPSEEEMHCRVHFFTEPAGGLIAKISRDGKHGRRALVSLPTNRELHILKWLENAYAFSADGRILMTGGREPALKEVATGQEIAKFPTTAHRGPITRVEFVSNFRHVVTAGGEASIVLWDWPKAVGLLPTQPPDERKLADYWEALGPDRPE